MKNEKLHFYNLKGGNKMINTTTFIGRISTDLELKKTNQEKSCCGFQLAVQRTHNDDADFPPMVAYGKLADVLCAYAKKGDLLGVRARYRSKIKNEKKYHEFVVDEIQFLERRNPKEAYEDIEIPQSSDTDFNPDSYSDDDLPF